MGTVARARIQLNGDVGGLGVSTWYMHNNAFTGPTTGNVTTWLSHIQTFWSAVHSLLSNKVTLTFTQPVEFLDIATEALTGVNTSFTDPGSVAGTSSAAYIAGVGARVNWRTSNIRHRRLVRGATHVTPITDTSYDTNGLLTSGVVTTVGTAAAAYVSAMAGDSLVPCVYSRPRPVSAGNGTVSDINSADTSVQPSWLRSRRT